MEIKLFRTEKKLMCRLPGDSKDTPMAELALGIMFLGKEKIKQKLGNELPILVAECELTAQETKDVEKINNYLKQIY